MCVRHCGPRTGLCWGRCWEVDGQAVKRLNARGLELRGPVQMSSDGHRSARRKLFLPNPLTEGRRRKPSPLQGLWGSSETPPREADFPQGKAEGSMSSLRTQAVIAQLLLILSLFLRTKKHLNKEIKLVLTANQKGPVGASEKSFREMVMSQSPLFMRSL